MKIEERIRRQLEFLYPPEQAETAWAKIQTLLKKFRLANDYLAGELSEKDAILITYGDSFQRGGELPLQTLDAFLSNEADQMISGVHILPFYPFSSDDGFSVIDYRAVEPRLGDWTDITRIGSHVCLMFDAVINHISRQSEWFQRFLQNQSPYNTYFIVPEPDWDLSHVIRPRTLPLLTEVETVSGVKKVWTTFSDDQIDLNYANPEVLLEIVSLLLFYVQQGARLIRLDAIAYLWKEPGTNCLHRPQTHSVIKLLRAVLDVAAPYVLLITETNVPHLDNISYYGETEPSTQRTDEAQLVYQFPLGPLVLHSFHTGSAERLRVWAAGLQSPGIFFNFLASHDGIGVLPAHGILSPAEIDALVETTLHHGGRVSYRSNPDGSQSPYELNITFYDAVNNPAQPGPEDIDRFVATQAILLSLAGVPGIYVHSLFGSRNWQEGVQQTGRARTINRARFDYANLQSRLADPTCREARVFSAYRRLLVVRREHPAFHPHGTQHILNVGPHVFALQRVSPDRHDCVLCLINVSSASQPVQVEVNEELGLWEDLINGQLIRGTEGVLDCSLAPYQVYWLTPKALE